jgi:hypothetical protein
MSNDSIDEFNLEETTWHDGNILEFCLSGPKSHLLVIRMRLVVPGTNEFKLLRILVSDINRISLIGDFSELSKNAFAGQVADARIDDLIEYKVLRMQLSSGYLEVQAKTFEACLESGN